jgi:hypothetical protein
MTARARTLFAVDRAGIFRENEEDERPATGAYFPVCNRARAESDEVNHGKDQANGGKKAKAYLGDTAILVMVFVC